MATSGEAGGGSRPASQVSMRSVLGLPHSLLINLRPVAFPMLVKANQGTQGKGALK